MVDEIDEAARAIADGLADVRTPTAGLALALDPPWPCAARGRPARNAHTLWGVAWTGGGAKRRATEPPPLAAAAAQVFPPELLAIFDAAELERVLFGAAASVDGGHPAAIVRRGAAGNHETARGCGAVTARPPV
jgi:hypothetical protein